MGTNIKKIVAREGLIFLFIFPALVSLAAWSNSSGGNRLPGNLLLVLGPAYILYLMIRFRALGNSIVPPTAKYRGFLREVPLVGAPIIFLILFLFANREFSNSPYLRAESSWKTILDGIFFAFFIIIPFYIVRFIIWAIKTLQANK